MISPDVAAAVTRLARDGVLAPEQARLFGRVARGELVSLSIAIQVLLYLGVVALTTGVGLLFKDQIANLGPITIAVGVGLVAALCLGWVARRSPSFSSTEIASPHFAFDYVLALGALLAAADLAFVEARFSPLGEQWPFHLLLVSAFYAALAFRFDSRTLFALSLTAFAAWRGVAATSLERAIFGLFNDTDALRLNTLVCGIAFVILGRELARRRVKAHFEPTGDSSGLAPDSAGHSLGHRSRADRDAPSARTPGDWRWARLVFVAEWTVRALRLRRPGRVPWLDRGGGGRGGRGHGDPVPGRGVRDLPGLRARRGSSTLPERGGGMRPESIAAERAKEVRDAARAWQRAGFLSEGALAMALALHPDDRHRFGPGFCVLAFVFTSIASWAIVGLSFVLFEPGGGMSSAFLLFWAGVLAALTEWQRGSWKRADAGAESATALAAVFLAIGSAISIEGFSPHAFVIRFLGAAFATCVIAAWRWGDRLFSLGAGLAFFGLLAQTGHGRLLWIVASSLLIPFFLKTARNPRLAPSHRRGAAILGGVAILALYGAIHLWSWDQQAIEHMESAATSNVDAATPRALRPFSILVTALLPPALLLIGWRRREPLLLYAGLLLVGVSIATIRLYHDVMPLSFALILIGAAFLALALQVRRWLRSGEGGERSGFTADPLFDNTNRTDAIKSVVAMASFTPAAQDPPAQAAFRGEGGGFGGGGATGSFQ